MRTSISMIALALLLMASDYHEAVIGPPNVYMEAGTSLLWLVTFVFSMLQDIAND